MIKIASTFVRLRSAQSSLAFSHILFVCFKLLFSVLFSSFGKRSDGGARRHNECIVLEPSEMIVVSTEKILFYLRQSRQIRERKVLFFLLDLLLLLLGDLGGLFSDLPYTLKKGASRENFSSEWVYPEKTFLQKGCIHRKLFFKTGASREKFSSKRVHPDKTFLRNGCIKAKLWFFF